MAAQSQLERCWALRTEATDAQTHDALRALEDEVLGGVEQLVRELPLNERIRRAAYQEVLSARGLAHG